MPTFEICNHNHTRRKNTEETARELKRSLGNMRSGLSKSLKGSVYENQRVEIIPGVKSMFSIWSRSRHFALILSPTTWSDSEIGHLKFWEWSCYQGNFCYNITFISRVYFYAYYIHIFSFVVLLICWYHNYYEYLSHNFDFYIWLG